MKNNERENDIFDALLRDALASDAAPSEDFTARLMEQVRRTPQEKPLRKQPVTKLLAAVAACAVIAVAIPLVTGGMGSSAADQAASADCAAPEASMGADADGAPRSQEGGSIYLTDEPADENGMSDGIQNNSENWKQMTGSAESVNAVTLTGQDARDAKAALDDMDIQPDAEENSRCYYVLTEQQAQELGWTVDALYGAEGSLTLILEVTE